MQAPDPIWVFIEVLENAKFDYIVTGSVASIFYGEPRLTHDLDLVLHLEKNQIKNFVCLFPLGEFYCPPEEVIGIELARRPYGHFNLIHHKSGFKADVYLEGNDFLQQWGLQNRKRIELSPELSLWLAPPEYATIRKLEYFREGRSEKHIRDIKNMMPQIGDKLRPTYELQASG